jgi:hypothetical protein
MVIQQKTQPFICTSLGGYYNAAQITAEQLFETVVDYLHDELSPNKMISTLIYML